MLEHVPVSVFPYLAPSPILAEIRFLVAGARGAGLDVDVLNQLTILFIIVGIHAKLDRECG